MYNQFYGFKENPFNQTPDSSFFYPSDGHKSALDIMLYAIHQRKGFVVMTGEVGGGKTTVTRTLLRRLDESVQTAVITNTHLSPKGVLNMILGDLGIPFKSAAKDRLLTRLNEYLLDQVRQDKNVVLLVDEAQNLTNACLEEIRMLSNLETEKEKLIQIILIGQPELKAKLELSGLAQLRQRISVHYHLNPLSQEDTQKYILHRLNVAKSNGRDMNALFEPVTFDIIHRYSRGVPRIINNICDHALLTGFVAEKDTITESIAIEAVENVVK